MKHLTPTHKCSCCQETRKMANTEKMVCLNCSLYCKEGHNDSDRVRLTQETASRSLVDEPLEEDVLERIHNGSTDEIDWHWKRVFTARKNKYNKAMGDSFYISRDRD